MKFFFWAVLRPDGKIITSTISSHKITTNWRASRLCKKELRKKWKAVKASGYRVVKLIVEVVT
jgi:hypothetical protein